MPITIDAHMHFWTLAFERHYNWMSPDVEILYRDYMPKDAGPHLNEAKITGVVLVSAAESEQETGYLLGIADTQEFVKGVVAWVDMLAPNAAKNITEWAQSAKLKAIRPYLQDISQDDWILQPQLGPAIEAIIEAGLRFDALIYPRHIGIIEEFVQRHPDLPIIVDHMAKPIIRNNEIEAWRADMNALARLKHVHCKVSGIVNECGPDWTSDRLAPYLDTVLQAFGPERLVWGSDWPAMNLTATYAAWHDTCRDFFSNLPTAQQDAIFGGNAIRFYGL